MKHLAQWLLFGLAGLPVAVARPVTLPDLSGTLRTIPEARAKVTVLLFIAHDCPIANGYAPEIQRIADTYAHRDVAFDLVYVEPGFSTAAARGHEATYGYHLSALRDTRHILVRMTDATVTPEAVVLSPQGRIVYRGRIDDKYAGLGIQRTVVTRHDLRDVLNAYLGGRPVSVRATQAVGCAIPALE